MSDLGIDEEADGTIEMPGFLEFIRRTLVADLPAGKMPTIHSQFEKEARSADPEGLHDTSGHTAVEQKQLTVSRTQAAQLLERLGLTIDELSLEETFEEVDGDGDAATATARGEGGPPVFTTDGPTSNPPPTARTAQAPARTVPCGPTSAPHLPPPVASCPPTAGRTNPRALLTNPSVVPRARLC